MTAPSGDALLGTRIGAYLVERVVGEGGMGRVYAATHATSGHRVALKVIARELARDAELLARFELEARAVARIGHESIARVIDLEHVPAPDARPAIVMELVEGVSLRRFAATSPAPSIRRLADVVGEVLAAVGAAHAIGIVHRDLKPDNVLVTTSGRAKVLDFGIAKLAGGLAGDPTPRTATGVLLGTPEYMAPEQIAGGRIDARTDLYAVGVLLYELATGHRPFEGDSEFEVLRAHVDDAPRPPSQRNRYITSALDSVILRALAKAPHDRFETAAAMAQALRDAVRGESRARLRTAGVAPIRRTGGPWPWIGAGLAVAAAGVGIGAHIGHRRSPFPSPSPTVPVARSPAPALDRDSTIDPTIDPTTFDWRAELERDYAEAQQGGPADLVRLSITGIDPSGRIDLAVPTAMMTATFRRRARPSGPGCGHSVYIANGYRQRVPIEICAEPRAEMPTCPLADVLARLAIPPGPKAMVYYSQDGWRGLGSPRLHPVADDCR